MASASQIKALLESHIEGDDSRFFATAMQLAAAEAKNGHGNLAIEIRRIIDQARTEQALNPSHKSPTLLVRPNKELSDLLTVSYPKVSLADMTLSEKLHTSLKRLLKEQRNIEKLKAHGLEPRRKILFTGAPGSGKSMAASAIAGELRMPLFVVRLDGLITKFMGESIAKLRLIFDSIQNTRAVYLFDEFDSIGSHRSTANDVGEIKRILNSFLMYIEHDESDGIIIAATNHPQSLDFALFRRFDELLEFSLPTLNQIRKFFKTRLYPASLTEKEIQLLSQEADGLSFADISIACDDAVKNSILSDAASLSVSELLDSLAARASFHSRYNKSK
jgi:SpoVK/Ycf46/Vps4 family AAA+-type ATPase